MSQRRRTVLPSLRASIASSSTAHSTPSLALPTHSTFPHSGYKLARVLSPRSASSSTSNPEPEPFSHDAWSAMEQQHTESDPDLDRITQPVMSRLLSDTLNGLPASFNPLIMRIVESHTTIRLENKRLRAQIDDAQQANRTLSAKQKQEASHWLLRELEYEKTIKTLQICLEHRAQSSDEAASRHPATDLHHPRVRAPSILEETDQSLDSFNRQGLLKFGAAATGAKATKKTASSPLCTPQNFGHKTGDVKASPQGRASHDSLSTFSGADTLSDDESASPDVIIDQDFASIRRLAEIMARRRGFTLEQALTQLTDAFYGEEPNTPSTAFNISSGLSSSGDTSRLPTSSETIARLRIAPTRSLIAEQHAHARSDGRTFSFKPGDDSSFASHMLDTLRNKETTTHSGTDSALSATSPSSYNYIPNDLEENISPTRSGAISARRERYTPASSAVRSPGTGGIKSRIPSPAYNSWSGVSRDRHEKSSSVSTAIRRSTPLESSAVAFDGFQDREKQSSSSDSN